MRKLAILGLTLAQGAVIAGVFVLPVAVSVWLEDALGGSSAASTLALILFVPVFFVTGGLMAALSTLLGGK